MRIDVPTFVFGCLLITPGASLAQPPQATALPREQLEPFLQTHCIGCHGEEKQKGQVRFDQLSWEISNNDEAQRWQDVLDQLNGGDMPPEEPYPSNEEMTAALDHLTRSLLRARRRLTDQGGEIRMRRLNRREYSNTIRHLFGFDVPFEDIPEDNDGSEFDTLGSDQYFTSRHFDAYLDLGREIAGEAFKWNTRPREQPRVTRQQPEEGVNRRVRELLEDRRDKLHLIEVEGKTWEEAGFTDAGGLQILLDQRYDRVDRLENYLARPQVESGVYIGSLGPTTRRVSISQHTDIRGKYHLRIHGGIVGDQPAFRHIARISDSWAIRGTARITGTPEAPETISATFQQSVGRWNMGLGIGENLPAIEVNPHRHLMHLMRIPREEREAVMSSIWIDWLELDGPHYPDVIPGFEAMLYPGGFTPGHQTHLLKEANARELLQTFAHEAFRRRTPEPGYIDALMALYQAERDGGAKHGEALQEAFAYILASPSFLFLHEEKADEDAGELNNRELAVRLAYFLWSAPPDDALYAADLSDEGILANQVRRMIDDERGAAFHGGFMGQWVELDRFEAITIDPNDHLRFNPGLRHDAAGEVVQFFRQLVEENLPARNLIDSDFVTVNAALANHYGIDFPPRTDDAFAKVDLPGDSPRGGLMTQAAFLVAGSNGERSSPVIRGALVMEKLLHDEPPPPPPNVPELGSADGVARSNREMVQRHQEQAVCASCHRKMDVIGFGLENFDTIGLWRDTERVGNRDLPIDPGGTLPGGASFASVQELKAALLTHERDLVEGLVESILAYGLGRTIEFSDADDIEAILEGVAPDGYRLRDIIREVALSPLVRKR